MTSLKGAVVSWNVTVAPGQFSTAADAAEAGCEAVPGVKGIVVADETPAGAFIVVLPTTVDTRAGVERHLRQAGISARARTLRPAAA